MISGLENGLYGVKDGEHCVILSLQNTDSTMIMSIISLNCQPLPSKYGWRML